VIVYAHAEEMACIVSGQKYYSNSYGPLGSLAGKEISTRQEPYVRQVDAWSIHAAASSFTVITFVPELIDVIYVFGSILNLCLYLSVTVLLMSSIASSFMRLIVQPPNPPHHA